MANVALLATVADSKASQQAGGASALMPSGVILPFAGSTSPTGWIVCDGAAYSQADYSELFAALGSAYNTQVNPTTGAAWAAPSAGQFRVPDMRGLFLRGEGTASGGDAVSVGGHQGGKTAKNGLG
jgi:microcystin-dependent protein